ncbi:hypothetical protein ACFSE1_14780 [Rhizobium helianthi]|uniref:Uncharacterized protein n=1 Tax=Rhizobium helianthi TaxID=1132695 RepID=A0ABW4M5L7_9HYPH
MERAYHVAEMTASEIDLAFPLAAAADIATDLDQWRRYCEGIIARQQLDGDERLMICANARGYLKAVCLARLTQTQEGAVLDVPMQVVATVLDEEGVREALQEGINALAHRTGSSLRS